MSDFVLKPVTEEALRAVVNATVEDQVRAEIKQLFESIGVPDVRLRAKAPRGAAADIVIDSLRLVIETKTRNKVAPNARGSRQDETQLEQVERYVRYFSESLFSEEDKPWRGFLSDGVCWYLYQWDRKYDRLRKLERSFYRLEEKNLASFDEFVRIYIAPENRQGKPSPPDDIISIFLTPRLERLQKILENSQKNTAFETKFNLWKALLKNSGLLPSERESLTGYRVFRDHTALVISSRLIIKILTNNNFNNNDFISCVEDGFCSWIIEIPQGKKWVTDLGQDLSLYNWRRLTRDILRETYENLIPRQERKEFGEYYTPDEVADKICQQVLDVEWLNFSITQAIEDLKKPSQFINKGIGVLDPACGSGTFLFQAARRIVNYAIKEKRLSDSDAAKIASRLVHGMDIHPVAVEMSKATLMTALPPDESINEKSLSVSLGDSLKTEKVTTAQPQEELNDNDNFLIRSSSGKEVNIPYSVLSSLQMSAIIDEVIDSAINNKIPSLIRFKLEKKEVLELKKATIDLTEIIKREGNHVWAWHIKNAIAPIKFENMKVDRMVGNPPWLVANDTPEGERKKNIEKMHCRYDLNIEKKTSAKGDLASVFSARVTDLYLKENGKIGYVFPSSALINQVWASWRKGVWGKINIQFTEAWDFKDIKPSLFPHSPNGACVILGKSIKNTPNEIDYPIHAFKTLDESYPLEIKKATSSYYHEVFKRGALFTPDGLVFSTNYKIEKNKVSFITKKSTKGVWKGISLTKSVEEKGVFKILSVKGLFPFSIEIDAIVIAPIFCSEESEYRMVELDQWPEGWLPELRQYWGEVEKIYKSKTTDSQGKKIGKGGDTLSENVNFKNSLTNQIVKNKTKNYLINKIIYNSSGSKLRAGRTQSNTLVGNSLYYWIADSEDEAAYLVGMLNAPSLQQAYRKSKTSLMHYHKRPLECVPIPKYDPNNKYHKHIMSETKRIEKIKKNNLNLSKETKTIDEIVAKILHEWCNLSSDIRLQSISE